MLELYLLPANPSQRALKLANTRYDGEVIKTSALNDLRPEIFVCFASPEDFDALLQQIAKGIGAFE